MLNATWVTLVSSLRSCYRFSLNNWRQINQKSRILQQEKEYFKTDATRAVHSGNWRTAEHQSNSVNLKSGFCSLIPPSEFTPLHHGSSHFGYEDMGTRGGDGTKWMGAPPLLRASFFNKPPVVSLPGQRQKKNPNTN